MTQDKPEQPPHSPATDSPTSGTWRFKPSLSLLTTVVITLILAMLYTNFHVKQALKQTNLATKQLHQEQLSLQNSFQQTYEDLQRMTEARLNAFETSLSQALKEQRYQASDWLMLKARYYLELASINNIWTNDYQTTSALLKEADLLLSTIQNESITEVRKAIAIEQTSIEAIPKIDITGLLSNLNALQKAVDGLNLPHESSLENKNALTSDTRPFLSKTWRDYLHQTAQTLQSLVVIRHHDDSKSAYMTADDVLIQREVIRLNLQEAQWAVLQHQTSIYHLLLTQTSEMVSRLFDRQNENTIAFINQIEALKKIDLMQPKPSLEDALNHLNQLIQGSEA